LDRWPIDQEVRTVAAEVDEVTRRLVHVRYAAAAVTEAEHGLRDAVRLARSAGATWGQVVEALRLDAPPRDPVAGGDERAGPT
jgi:hypothetical protein